MDDLWPTRFPCAPASTGLAAPQPHSPPWLAHSRRGKPAPAGVLRAERGDRPMSPRVPSCQCRFRWRSTRRHSRPGRSVLHPQPLTYARASNTPSLTTHLGLVRTTIRPRQVNQGNGVTDGGNPQRHLGRSADSGHNRDRTSAPYSYAFTSKPSHPRRSRTRTLVRDLSFARLHTRSSRSSACM